MSTRDTILSAIRAGLGVPPQPPEAIAAEAAALLADLDTTRPRLAAATLPEAFTIKATALGTTFEQVADLADVPQAVGRYLQQQGLSPSIALQGAAEFQALDWAGLQTHDSIAPDEPAAVGLALWGIAESGSIVVHSGADTPILLSFLPMHHIVVLRESTLLPYLEDYAEKLATTATPRNVVLITGPSGTTDIEGSYVRGAHGPGFVHIVMVSGA